MKMAVKVKGEQDIQCLATFVHGVLAALHALGIAYNIKRRNWFDVAAHSAAMSYDIWATAKHIDAWERLAADTFQDLKAREHRFENAGAEGIVRNTPAGAAGEGVGVLGGASTRALQVGALRHNTS